MKKITFFVFLFVFTPTMILLAQEKHAFWNDVQTIKKYDRIYTPPEDPILFIGSSSIRKWPNPQKVFCKHTIIDRGIGGAVINDMIYYADDIIFPYHPKKLVIYVGENDVPNKAETPDTILNHFKNLYALLRDSLPEIPIVFISMKPSPVREQYWAKERKANTLIKDFLYGKPHVRYMDIYSKMVTKDGKPRPELFGKDMLHMNEKGYAIWNKMLKKYLK